MTLPGEYKLQIYITRHGETWGNLPPLPEAEQNPAVQGERHDPELTPLGLEQARLLGARLSVVRFSAVFSSPLVRTVSTAYEVSTRQPGGPVSIEIIPELAEIGTPWSYKGIPVAMLSRRYPDMVFEHRILSPREDWEALEATDRDEAYLKRARQCIAYFRSRFQQGESIFVAAHGSFNTFLIRAALGLENSAGFNFCQENTGLTKVKYFLNDEARLSYSNDTSHLFADKPLLTATL